ncbi:MAG: adenine deaminase C-terminal domain-containing protein [Candidatus Margulisbacteria bacterium]|nr:adenine deaminase C-terminal domain-containing protein [Candidatus Margulisiibacteriota bacterium]
MKMDVKHFEVDDLRIKKPGKYVKVIELLPDEVITKHWVTKYTGIDLERDILKLVVMECRAGSGKMGFGYVKGFGLSKGAIAESFTADAGTIICVGKSDEDIASAIRRVAQLQGGVAIVAGGMILNDLKVGGHGKSAEISFDAMSEKMKELHETAHGLGCKLEDPFSALSLLSLPSIPELRITDHGLLDVSRAKIIDLFE